MYITISPFKNFLLYNKSYVDKEYIPQQKYGILNITFKPSTKALTREQEKQMSCINHWLWLKILDSATKAITFIGCWKHHLCQSSLQIIEQERSKKRKDKRSMERNKRTKITNMKSTNSQMEVRFQLQIQ